MIHIKTDTFNVTNTGTITGVIFIEIDNKYFPEENWNDFPVIILNWWLEKAITNIEGEYRFMDGPFRFNIYYEKGEYYITCFYNGKQVINGKINSDKFLKELVMVAIEIIQKYKLDRPNLYISEEMRILVKNVEKYVEGV